MRALARWNRSLRFILPSLALPAFSRSEISAQQPAAWSVETHTGPTRMLTFDATEATWSSVTISPDGRTIAFDLLGHLYEMPIEGGTAKRLTEGRSWNLQPRYSPDGRSIAFSSDRSGSHNIWILDRQTRALRTFPAPDENLYRPIWSADGRLVYAGTSGDGIPNQFIAYSLSGGRQSLISDVSVQASLLPANSVFNGAEAERAGTGIIFERSNRPLFPFGFNPYVIPIGGARIERYDQASGEVTVMVERQGGAFAPALSPDGRQLAYLTRSIDRVNLILRDLATRRERTLVKDLDRDRQESFSLYGPYPVMAWHPDGRRVFLVNGGRLLSIDTGTGKSTVVQFHAPVERQMSETIRFKRQEATGRAMTRMTRWATRTPQGILFEALGDLWLQDAPGTRRNLTNSTALETAPTYDSKTGALYYASWTDDSLGAIYRSPSFGAPGERLTSVPAQYGSIAVSPDGTRLAYVRGAGGLEHGLWLSNEAEFDLMLRSADGSERRVTGITGQPLEYANIAGKVPPSVVFTADGGTLYFTEFERDTLVLKRIATEGGGEALLYRFPNAVEAAPSPDLGWIAFREYHRSFITPLAYAGQPVSISPFESIGLSTRVDSEDGHYLTWSTDGRSLGWSRATGFYEKAVDQIVTEARGGAAVPTGGSWTDARVPGSTARRTETAMELAIDTPKGTVALTGVRAITMNPTRQVIEGATVVIEGDKITAIGKGAQIPAGAKVFDLSGRTVIPGLVDAHAHPHIEHSPLHVIEQQPTYLSGPLAYGVTTVIEVYGNEYRDGWLSDMIRAGKITGPRYFTTGSVIYGQRNAARLRMYRPIQTLEDAREQLRWNKDHGAIAVKDYLELTRKQRHLVMTAARELGLEVVSESDNDPQMNLTQLMDGMTGLEHSMGLAPFYDDIVRYWGGTTAGMTPTLLVVYNAHFGEGWYHQTSKLWVDPKLTHFVTPEQLMRVRNPIHLWPEDMYAWKMATEVKKLFLNGTSIQMGGHGQMFGLDDHWELDLLVRGGFTPAQALEIGTIRGATHHGLDSQLGSLEVGKLADLVVLDANPLVDIANAQKIRYVMKNGILFAGTDVARVWPDPRPIGKPYFVRP